MKRVIDYNGKPRVKMDGTGVDLARAFRADISAPGLDHRAILQRQPDHAEKHHDGYVLTASGWRIGARRSDYAFAAAR